LQFDAIGWLFNGRKSEKEIIIKTIQIASMKNTCIQTEHDEDESTTQITEADEQFLPGKQTQSEIDQYIHADILFFFKVRLKWYRT
jgi:hypothetical protein